MAIIKGNIFLAGASGKIQNLVYKQMGGQTIVCTVPDMENRVLSEKQLKTIKLMKLAIAFAKRVINDPQKKEEACKMLKVTPNKVFRAIVSEFIKTDAAMPRLDGLFASK